MPRAANTTALGPVSRSVKVLRYLSENGHTTIQDASAALSLAPSTVHRLLDLLLKEGMVEHEKSSRTYSIGLEFYRISAQVISRHDIRKVATPILQEITQASNETCVFGVYLQNQRKMIFVEKSDSNRMLRYQLPMNEPISVLWGASGRSILAYLPQEEISWILSNESKAPASGAAVPAKKQLEKNLQNIRERGFAVSYGEKVSGAVGISAPVFGSEGTIVGSICITAPDSNVKATDEERFGKLVKDRAAELSRKLGYSAASHNGNSKTAANKKRQKS